MEMVIGCEYAGHRIGFGFDVDLTEEEMLSLANIYFHHEDVREDFENLRKYDERIYWKIYRLADDVLDDEMGEDTIKTARRVSWGSEMEDMLTKAIGNKSILG